MSSLAARLADEGIPLSTAKWSLRNLRSLGLIRCGDEGKKGIPVKLTTLGRLLAEVAREDLNNRISGFNSKIMRKEVIEA